MGVALNHVYTATGGTKSGLLRSWRTRLEARCTDVQKKTWEVRLYLQCKAKGTSGEGNIHVEFGKGSYSDNHFGYRASSSNVVVNDSFNCTQSFKDVVMYHAYTYTDSGSVASATISGNFCIWIGSLGSEFSNADFHDMDVPACEYGGIDYSPPTILFPSRTISDYSITQNYRITAPYRFNVTFQVLRGGSIQQRITANTNINSMSSASALQITNLTPNTKYTIRCIADCETGVSKTLDADVTTLPVYVSSIAASDLDIDEGETVTLTPSVSPNDATFKNVDFLNDGSGYYKFGNAWSSAGTNALNAASVSVYGIVKGTGSITIRARDSNAVTKTIAVNVYRPAERIVPSVNSRKIFVGTPYHIQYSILPDGSTDTEVSFVSSDTDVLTVDANGVVTGVAAGAAEVVMTLQRRGKQSVQSRIVFAVDASRGWIGLEMPEMLTFGFVDDVYNNLAYLKEHMPNEGNIVFPDTPQTGDGNGIPVFMVGSILNTIESCIDVLMSALNALSSDPDGYRAAAQQDYGSAFVWSGTVSNMTEHISRWLSWARNVYAYLEIEDESQSTITENENQIIVTVIDQADDVGSAIYIFDDEEGEGND